MWPQPHMRGSRHAPPPPYWTGWPASGPRSLSPCSSWRLRLEAVAEEANFNLVLMASLAMAWASMWAMGNPVSQSTAGPLDMFVVALTWTLVLLLGIVARARGTRLFATPAPPGRSTGN